MEPSKLIRDANKVKACIQELDDGRLVAKKTLKIYIPVRFAERGLAFIGLDIMIVGIYAIVVDNLYYGISLVNAMMPITPTATVKIKIDGDDYYEFYFEAGSTIVPSTQLVKDDALVYKIYDELMSKGRVPWYIGYDDFAHIFDTASKHAGTSVGKNHEVTELIVSILARDIKDRHKFYRTSIKSLDDAKHNPPAFIALRSVIYAATNTTNKLAGSYFSVGVVSALNSPSSRQEKIEQILTR